MLQLQRVVGNRAVGELIAEPQSTHVKKNSTNNIKTLTPSSNSIIQRALWKWQEGKWVYISGDNQEKGAPPWDGKEEGEETEYDGTAAAEFLEIIKVFDSQMTLSNLQAQLNDLFKHLENKLIEDNIGCLITIGQSPELFREYIKLTKPNMKIVHIDISGVSEAYDKEPFYGQNDVTKIVGDLEEEEFMSEAGKYLYKIYQTSGLKDVQVPICIVDYSNKGNTLKFFSEWLIALGHQEGNVKTLRLNDGDYINLKDNILLKLLKSKSDGPAKQVLDKLRVVKNKIEVSNVQADDTPEEDEHTLELLKAFATLLSKF